MERVETKKKFLIETPLKWYGKFKISKTTNSCIYQSYIENDVVAAPKSCVRIRTMISNGGYSNANIYTLSRRTFVDATQDGLIVKENEEYLTSDRYRDLIKKTDPTRHMVIKDRYFLNFSSNLFKLDFFKANLEGLVIMETEKNKYVQNIFLLPPHFKIIDDITNDKRFYNYNLAKINSIADTVRLVNSVREKHQDFPV